MSRLRTDFVVAAVLALAILGPALGPGQVLAYDMVFTPRQQFSPAGLGLATTLPRAVPVDAVVSALSTVVPGGVLQKGFLFGTLFAAALGAARATRAEAWWVRAAAGVLYAWNPYVAERLFIGHWALLIAYATLPWLLVANRRDRGRLPLLAVLLGVAALTPSGGVLAVIVALATAGGWRRIASTGVLALVLNAPWWLPAVLHPAVTAVDPAGAAAFAIQPENWSGRLGAVLGFGGIWNADVVPASRTTFLAPILAALVLAIATLGLIPFLRQSRALLGLAVVAGLGLAVALASPWGALWQAVPGGGLLRDGQKWLAPWALLVSLGFAMGARWLVDALRRREVERHAVIAVVAGALLLPIAALPDLALGGLGRLTPVHYPADWSAVRERIAAQPSATVVLPFRSYRRFEWNGARPSLDPAPRFFPGEVIVDDTLYVGGTPVAGEDRRAAAVREELRRPMPNLAGLGVGWVIMERTASRPGAIPTGLTSVYDGPTIALYRVDGAVAATPKDGGSPPWLPVVLADIAAGVLFIGALTATMAGVRGRTRRDRGEERP